MTSLTRRAGPIGVVCAMVLATLSALTVARPVSAQGPPPPPMIYSGSVTAGGEPVPDGFAITARLGDIVTDPVLTKDGEYVALLLNLPDSTYVGRQVVFFLSGLQAQETDIVPRSSVPVIRSNFNLTFPRLPEPTPTPSPVPTATAVPTPTPGIPSPAVYAGSIIVAGGSVPEVATLVARIDDYESTPALIQGETYRNLVVDPQDGRLVGVTVEFLLNGVKARTTDIFREGSFNREFNLTFIDFPGPTPTPEPATATPVPTPIPGVDRPTPTPITRHPTVVPPTPTPTVRPVSTPTPSPSSTPTPSPTPVPPTATATAIPGSSGEATPTPTSSGGGCSLPFAQVSGPTGAANSLFLFGPLMLAVGLREWRRRK